MTTDVEVAPPKHRFTRPTVGQMSALVGLVASVVALVFIFKPGWQPRADSDVMKAAITEVKVVQPVSFRRYLQRQLLPVSTSLSRTYLARRGVMIPFHYEIVGLRGKQLPLRWELSDAQTNDLVASEDSAFKLTPASNDEAADWSVWLPAPKPGREYYVTVTIYQPKGAPYELKHFDSPTFAVLG